ncbi:Lrp/AsnC family transcriptional regulator [Trinickia mobilis]|uniref:Lrp/AsnC family transcriptional regulator n=1 Tax=Trinickia mobilis TaxID=2816356 RepID=UPI001A8F7FD6|nr:Lrp/AsnC family transcriptional regulator [Trinickia mobilis]
MKLDAIDKRILQALQRDARIHNTELANLAGLSPSPCLRRVRLLEEAEVIDRYVALLRPAAVGLGMTVFVRVTLDRQDQAIVEHFSTEIQQVPQVLECYLMAGGYDFLLRVVVTDLDDYRQFQQKHISGIRGVRNVETEIPLQRIKLTTELPL